MKTASIIRGVVGFRGSVILFLTCFLSTFCFSHPDAGAHQKGGMQSNGFLKVETEHRNLVVVIDGIQVGTTPLSQQALRPGTHRVRISHPDYGSWLAHDWASDVEILPGQTRMLSVVFDRYVAINSQPYNATVFVGGSEMGKTPCYLKIKDNETLIVTLSTVGYSDSTFAVTSKADQSYRITLVPDNVPAANLNLDFFEPRNKKNRKSTFWLTAGLTAASSALAFYLRDKADSKYDRYLRTGEPNAMKKYYNEARKYDKFAGAAFATFQVSFVVSFYLYLKKVNK